MKVNPKIQKVNKNKFYSYLQATCSISKYEMEQLWIYGILGGSLNPSRFPDFALTAWRQAGGK